MNYDFFVTEYLICDFTFKIWFLDKDWTRQKHEFFMDFYQNVQCKAKEKTMENFEEEKFLFQK